jgi:hypothetical protein
MLEHVIKDNILGRDSVESQYLHRNLYRQVVCAIDSEACRNARAVAVADVFDLFRQQFQALLSL